MRQPSPNQQTQTIVTVIGARPNFVKIASFIRHLESHKHINSILVHTGQHYDPDLSDIFFDQLGIRKPDLNLNVGSGSHAQQTANIMLKFEPILAEKRPSCVVVVGDVNSTVACSLVAKKMGVPTAHIEAGLRSNDESMPEEINRKVTDLLSEIFFTTSKNAGKNLEKENVPSNKIHFVGNIMIDSLVYNLDRAKKSNVLMNLKLEQKKYILLTMHRPSNVDDPKQLEKFMAVFTKLNKKMPIVFVAHPRTKKLMLEASLLAKDLEVSSQDQLLHTPSFRMSSPLGYLEMLSLQMNAALVLTDSGGIQEETTVLGVPCLTLRENTERPETVEIGTNQVIGTNPETILTKANEVLSGKVKNGQCPELWDGKTGERIVNHLLNFLQTRN